MVCLGFEPGPQDGRRRRYHGAMAATLVLAFWERDIWSSSLSTDYELIETDLILK